MLSHLQSLATDIPLLELRLARIVSFTICCSFLHLILITFWRYLFWCRWNIQLLGICTPIMFSTQIAYHCELLHSFKCGDFIQCQDESIWSVDYIILERRKNLILTTLHTQIWKKSVLVGNAPVNNMQQLTRKFMIFMPVSVVLLLQTVDSLLHELHVAVAISAAPIVFFSTAIFSAK